MLLLVPMSFLADIKSFDPFPEVQGAPFAYPGSYEPGRELNNQAPGNMWLPDPHPYAAAQVWPPITEVQVDVSMYPAWLSPVRVRVFLLSSTVPPSKLPWRCRTLADKAALLCLHSRCLEALPAPCQPNWL